MAWLEQQLGELWRRLLFPWRRAQLDRDLDEDMRFHMEMKAASAPETTCTADQARRQARIAFGNSMLGREICREAWGWSWIAADQNVKPTRNSAWF